MGKKISLTQLLPELLLAVVWQSDVQPNTLKLRCLTRILLAGFRVAFRNAIFGGVILAMIGLVEMGMIKYQMRMEMREMHAMQKMANEKETEALRQMHPRKLSIKLRIKMCSN